MKIRMQAIIERAVEEGIESGWNRAHKHSESPSVVQLKEEIYTAIMNKFDEVVSFTDEADL